MKKILSGLLIVLMLLLPSISALPYLKSKENEEIINRNKGSVKTDIIITNIFDYNIELPGPWTSEGLKMTLKNIGDEPIESWADYEFRGKFERFRFIFPKEHVDDVIYGFSTSKEILPGESFNVELTFGDEAYDFPFYGIYKVTASFWCNKDSNPDNNEYIEFYKGFNFIGFSWTELPNFRPLLYQRLRCMF